MTVDNNDTQLSLTVRQHAQEELLSLLVTRTSIDYSVINNITIQNQTEDVLSGLNLNETSLIVDKDVNFTLSPNDHIYVPWPYATAMTHIENLDNTTATNATTIGTGSPRYGWPTDDPWLEAGLIAVCILLVFLIMVVAYYYLHAQRGSNRARRVQRVEMYEYMNNAYVPYVDDADCGAGSVGSGGRHPRLVLSDDVSVEEGRVRYDNGEGGVIPAAAITVASISSY